MPRSLLSFWLTAALGRKDSHLPHHIGKPLELQKHKCAASLFQQSSCAATTRLMPGLPLATTYLGLEQLASRRTWHRFCRASSHCWNAVPNCLACHIPASYTAVKPSHDVTGQVGSAQRSFGMNVVMFSLQIQVSGFWAPRHPTPA